MIDVENMREADQLIITHLKSEVMRLKLKCGEGITVENLNGDFGQPMAFNIVNAPNKSGGTENE